MKKVFRSVPMILTEQQKQEKSETAAHISETIEIMELSKKKYLAEFRRDKKDLTNSMKRFLSAINSGVEMTSVECEERKNFETREVEYWHEGVKVDARPMTEEDTQTEFQEMAG